MPAALVLVAVAAADRLGLASTVFYLFLAGIPVSGAGAFAAFGHLVDAENTGRAAASDRVRAVLAATLVLLFVLGAASRSPISLELGAPGLARAALFLGFLVVAGQALVALVPERRSAERRRSAAPPQPGVSPSSSAR